MNDKGTIQQDITIVNIYASSMEEPKYIKQLLVDIKKNEIDSNTIIGLLNTHTYING